MVFYGMYLTVGIVGIAASLVFTFIYCNIASSFRKVRFFLKRTLYVISFQIFHIVIISFNLSVRAYTLHSRHDKVYGIWLVDAFTIPIGVIIVPLGYVLCFYPVEDILLRGFNSIAHKCCLRNYDNVIQQRITKNATAPESDRITQPSCALFVVLYPDNFTDEKSLLFYQNTGYGRNC